MIQNQQISNRSEALSQLEGLSCQDWPNSYLSTINGKNTQQIQTYIKQYSRFSINQRSNSKNNNVIHAKLSSFLNGLILNIKELILTPSSTNHIITHLNSLAQLPNNNKVTNTKYKKYSLKKHIEEFLEEYCKYLTSCINKIHKYNYNKKLKYLVQTVCQQVFIEILTLSYDLHTERIHYLTTRSHKSAFLLQHLISSLINRRGFVQYGFMRVKHHYQRSIKDDIQFVDKFQMKINNLSLLYRKKVIQHKSCYFYKWRVSSQIKSQLDLYKSLQFPENIVSHLTYLLKALQYNSLPRKLQQMITQLFNSLLSDSSNNHHSIHFISCGIPYIDNEINHYLNKTHNHDNEPASLNNTLVRCLDSGQIQFENIQKNRMVIPVGKVGVLQLRWQTDIDMNIFRTLMKVLQHSIPIIQNVYGLCEKLLLAEQWKTSNSYQKKITQQYLQQSKLQHQISNSIKYPHTRHQMKLSGELLNELGSLSQRSNQSQLNNEIRANQRIQRWFKIMDIYCLTIYHNNCKSNAPCLSFNDYLPFSHQIIQTIFNKFNSEQTNSEGYFQLHKNAHNIHIVQVNGGFCKYILNNTSSINTQQIHHRYVSNCLVPMLLTNISSKHCQQCSSHSINPKYLNLPNQHYQLNINQPYPQLSFPEVSKILQCQYIPELQQLVFTILKKHICKKLFCSILYPLTDNKYWMISKSNKNNQQQFRLIQFRFNHSQNRFNSDQYKQISKLLKQNPIFQNAELQLYEQISPMNIIYSSNKRKCIVIVGYYDNGEKNNIRVNILKQVTNNIMFNKRLLYQGDIFQWFDSNFTNPSNNSQSIDMLCLQIQQQSLTFQKRYNPLKQSWYQSIKSYISNVLIPDTINIDIFRYRQLQNCFVNLQNKQKYTSSTPFNSFNQCCISHSALPSRHLQYVMKSNQHKNKLKPIYIPIPHFEKQAPNSLQSKLHNFLQHHLKIDSHLVKSDQYQKILSSLGINSQQHLMHLIIPNHHHKILTIISLNSQCQNKMHEFHQIICKYLNSAIHHNIIKLNHYQQHSYIQNIFLSNKISQKRNKNQKVKQAISKFQKNRKSKHKNIEQAYFKFKNIFQKKQNYFKSQAYYQIEKYSFIKLKHYQNGAQYLKNTINIILFRNFIQKIRYKYNISMLNQTIQKIIFNKHILNHQKQAFQEILQYSRTNLQIVNQHKKQGILVLKDSLVFILKNKYRLLFNNYHKIQRGIYKLTELVMEQYELTAFETIHSFLLFTHDRLSCAIRQIAYSYSIQFTIAIIQGNILYSVGLSNTQGVTITHTEQQLIQSEKCRKSSEQSSQIFIKKQINIMQIPNNVLIYTISGNKKLNNEDQSINKIINHAVLPSYRSYISRYRFKILFLLKAFPNNIKKSFNIIKLAHPISIEIIKAQKEYKQQENNHQLLQKEYCSLDQANQNHQRKVKLKKLQQKLSHMKQTQNQQIVNLHIKRKTNAAHRIVAFYQLPKNIQKNHQFQQYPNNQLQQQRNRIFERKSQFFCKKLKRIFQNNIYKLLKTIFAKLWIVPKYYNQQYFARSAINYYR